MAAAKTYVDRDVFCSEQRNVLDEQCDHALALERRRALVVPDAREISGEGKDTRACLFTEQSLIGLALPLVLLLKRIKRAKARVPVGLERIGHETIIGIDFKVPSSCELGVVARPLEL